MTEAREDSLFRWGTLKALGAEELAYKDPVLGTRYDVELVSGMTIHVWRSLDGQQYFCHGLTFGGIRAPGGAISPFSGTPVETILRGHYDFVPNDMHARTSDILVCRGVPGALEGTTPHSAILTAVVWTPGRAYLDCEATRLQTKNGITPERNSSLGELFALYGETYDIYRRQPPGPDSENEP